jgi:hypothetical protein
MPEQIDYEELIQNLGLADPRKTAEEAISALRHLLSQREELRKALEPFANAAAAYDPATDGEGVFAWDHQFALGDLRLARSTLEECK